MDGTQDGNGQAAANQWPATSQFQPSTQFTTNPAHSFVTSQAAMQTYAQLTDSQIQALAQGNFQQFYQATTSQPAGFERVSPVDDYGASTSVSTAADLQSFRGLTTDGQIIRVSAQPLVTVLLGGTHPSLAQLQPSALHATSQGITLSSQDAHCVSSLVSQSLASTLEEATAGSTITIGGNRDQSVTIMQPQSTAGDQSVSDGVVQAPMLQVTPIARLDQAESTTSEATPLVSSHGDETDQAVTSIRLTLQDNRTPTPKIDSYSNEPDTTQEDITPRFTHVTHDGQNGFSDAGPSHLDMDGGGDQDGLHSTMGGTEVHPACIVDSTMDGVVSATDHLHTEALARGIVHSMTAAHMDPHIGTSGISAHHQPVLCKNEYNTTGGEGDIEQMLASAAGSSGVHYHQGELPQPSHIVDEDEEEDDDEDDDDDEEGETDDDEDDEEEDGGEDDKENLVRRNLTQQFNQELRKSERIANLDRFPSAVRPSYIPHSYNPLELWCEDCLTTYKTECPKHRLQVVFDKVVLSRAWASLPPQLQIFRLGETTDLGVFARKPIQKRTQFGPYIGELVDSQDKLTNHRFVIQLERETGELCYFESSDENKCNWMMFIRPAESYGEQNLVAYQYGTDIYFSTIKNVEPKQELKVWYAAHYAHRLGVRTHEMSMDDLQGLDGIDAKWPCYECNKKFRSSALLQKHLLVHDENQTYNFDGDDDEGLDQPLLGKQHRKNVKKGKARPQNLLEQDGTGTF